MKVLLIDAFDSFVFMIAQYYQKIGADTRVVRVNQNPLEIYKKWKPDLLVLGPGPGTPRMHGYLNILRNLNETQAIFGICLGHQAIGEYFGWKLEHAKIPEHGKYSTIYHDGKGIFSEIPNNIKVVRYHSLIINEYGSSELISSAKTESDHIVMAIRHIFRPIEGVQFHPESIGTEFGLKIIENSLNLCKIARECRRT